MNQALRRGEAWLWLAACALTTAALVWLFPDSCQQDGGHHYLFARWAWTHPELLVGVWSRPLFTLLYSLPAQRGYPAAKLFSALISLFTAWQAFRLAEEMKLARAPLIVPLLFLQPSFFLLCADTLTEPLFALIFVSALRLHLRGRVKAGMLAASTLILARPEGVFLGALWGVWVLLDQRDGRAWWRRWPSTLLLASGALLWWLAAWLLTGDPLFIKHNWPMQQPLTGTSYGQGAWWSYAVRLPEIAGLWLLPPFLYGLARLLAQRKLGALTSTFLLFFALHSVLRAHGLLGSAGYPRYFVAISPAIALITLAGWNELAARFAHRHRRIKTACAALILAISAYTCFLYMDGAEWIRDARAVAEMHARFLAQPVRRLIWSQAYMCIRFDRDPWEKPVFADNHTDNLRLLRESPGGTLVFWDERIGPAWHRLTPADFEAAGYRRLQSQAYTLRGYLLTHSWFGYGGPRRQSLHLLYKPLSDKLPEALTSH
jgi:hypothetical protein